MEIEINKTDLRKQIRQALKGMSKEQCVNESQNIWSQLEHDPVFEKAETILLYWSLENEVETRPFIEKWSNRKKILLPVVIGDILVLRVYEGVALMREGAYGILEPQGREWEDYGNIDLCIIPGVGFDKEGHRMGHGKGYYDRLLNRLHATTYGICFSTQLVDKIPTDPWDIGVDKVIYPL